MYAVILFLHVLGATIWVGGHLVLAVCWLPRIVRERAPEQLLAFEQRFERLGMSALALQVVTGVWMAHQLVPDVGQWLHPQSPLAHAIALKLGLLLATAAVAVHARLRVLPRLTPATLPLMAGHVLAVTALGVAFVAAGVALRFGGF
ncbi:CopD family protein [Ottowia sp.]|uniref:CopD family protein n=1 Tax=Ottowia sp. TaxID=1898956 RepID=UPI00394BFA1E